MTPAEVMAQVAELQRSAGVGAGMRHENLLRVLELVQLERVAGALERIAATQEGIYE